MMKLKLNVFIVVLCMCAAVVLWAEDKKPEPKIKHIPVYLGQSDLTGGPIPADRFKQLVKQGLTSKDSIGRPYKVDGFLFTYGERNLYEDSVGNLMKLTDLLTEACSGDTLSTFIQNIVKERVKAGDTIYFDQVYIHGPEANAHGKGMRFEITK